MSRHKTRTLRHTCGTVAANFVLVAFSVSSEHIVPMSEISIQGDTAIVPISNGALHAVIDIADIPLVEGRRWGRTRANGKCYAICRENTPDGRRVNIFMHRLILQPQRGSLVDHRDGDGLNNRRSNLRQCTHAENMRNTFVRAPNKTGYKGVWEHGAGFYASIQKGGQKKRIGPFSTPELAAAAYAGAATILFGEFARFDLP